MEIRNNIYLIIFLCLLSCQLSAQKTFIYSNTIQWEKGNQTKVTSVNAPSKIWNCSQCKIKSEHPGIPLYSKLFKLTGPGKAKISIINPVFSPINLSNSASSSAIKESIELSYHVIQERNEYWAGINFIPFRRTIQGSFERLISFDIEIQQSESTEIKFKDPVFSNSSVLKEGQIFKLSIPTSGIYKINYQFVKDSLQIAPENIDPRQIKLYSHHSGPLPEAIPFIQDDDLIEIPVYSPGEADGQFNPDDFMLFYGPGPDKTEWSSNLEKFEITTNTYARQNFVFLILSTGNGRRIEDQNSNGTSGHLTSVFDQIIRFEENHYNLLGEFGSTQGSGREWYGSIFTNLRRQDFSSQFRLAHVDITYPVDIHVGFAARSKENTQIILDFDGNVISKDISKVNTGDIESRYARNAYIDEKVYTSSSQPNLILDFPNTSTISEGWLDFIQLKYKRKIILEDEALILRDISSLDHPISGFSIPKNVNKLIVWDITDELHIRNQLYEQQNNSIQFTYPSEVLRSFAIFHEDMAFPIPAISEKVENQDIHSIQEADLVIIYYPEFAEAANRLAEHRRTHSAYQVESINVLEIFNEFSSGKQDPTAIRNFAKMLYDRSDRFKFLMLFGDGSYDYRHIIPGLQNQSFIPVFETHESLDPLSAFPTDDYFALLSDHEGGSLKGALDISVGRIPVKSLDEANDIVDKIIDYDTNYETFNDWRLRIAFLADDEDNNIHLNQADIIAKSTNQKHPEFNQQKIYFDAFPQVSTPGGARYPSASDQFNNSIFNGLVVANYLGHGGPSGWSQERVLRIDDITNWTNGVKMPLIITATCSFTGFDDPALVTAGEQAFLNNKGGAIALFSTVRSVYSSQNFRLTRSVFDTIFTKENGDFLAIGEVMRRAKNSNSADTINVNARKFLLIGDPSMHLALPQLKIRTDEVNGQLVGNNLLDTLNALELVNVKGSVLNKNDQLDTDFNGTLYVTVFDKESSQTTLSNDPGSPKKQFTIQRNILFKGEATVRAGDFEFSFVVPKDINYNFGKAKISYYASDKQHKDAQGYFNDIIVGGTSDSFNKDEAGPEVKIFLNDEKFVSGSITNDNPTLLVHLNDESGINQSGTSIGHDIVAILDDDTQNTIILNEFYTASIDDFRSGTVRFPLKDLSMGQHSLHVRAFDTANNPGESRIDFVVTNVDDKSLQHVLNYPNPFTTSTAFNFEHDLPNIPLQLAIDIYTVSGKIVKSIRESIISGGFRVDNIHWDGKDDFGNQLGKGIYLYKIKINAEGLNISKESAFEKLVILR